MSPIDRLDAAVLRAALGHQLIGNRIVVLDEATSTNDVVAQMSGDNAEGLVVIAEKQTAGRGQYGRRWESAAGKGLWLSILLRPKIALTDSSRIVDLLTGAIVATLAEKLEIAAKIKPPNDIYIGERKVAGVLVAMRVELSGGYCAIAGLGLNVNHAAEDFPAELRETASSLAMITGHQIDRSRLTVSLLRNLALRYAGR